MKNQASNRTRGELPHDDAEDTGDEINEKDQGNVEACDGGQITYRYEVEIREDIVTRSDNLCETMKIRRVLCIVCRTLL